MAKAKTRRKARPDAFTIARIEAFKPRPKRQAIRDGDCRGLTLVIEPTGIKTFYFYGRVARKPQRIRLGLYPTLTIDNARLAVQVIWGDVASGRDPVAPRRQQSNKNPSTLGEVFDWWLQHHAKAHRGCWQKDEARWNNYLREWSKRSLEAVSPADVKAKHSAIGATIENATGNKGPKFKGGPVAANQVLEMLQWLYKAARENGWTSHDPTRGVKLYDQHARERFLHATEMQKFFAAVKSLSPSKRDCILLCLWSGQRRSNVESMRWAEVDIEQALWNIPGSKFKNGRPHTVPLPLQAIEILLRQKRTSEWVFPSRRSKTGHIGSPKQAWAKVLTDSGLEDLTPHDLRRTWASWQSAAGVPLQVIGKGLGHRSPQSTAIYARLQLDPVREAINQATAAIDAAGKNPESSK